MLNLTRQEILVIKFLVGFFIVGGLIHIVKTLWIDPSDDELVKGMTDSVAFVSMAKRVDSLYREKDRMSTVSEEASEKSVKQLININTASKQELMKLPKIGEVTSERIILYRLENGNFSSLDQLLEVKGIGKKTLERIRGDITIE